MSKSPLRNKTVRSGKKSSSFQDFSKFATIIGFFNDLIGLITFTISIASFVLILLSDSRNNDGIVLPLVHITVTPMYLLILWIIALYGYFSYLRVYWINNLEEKMPNSNFAGFVFDILLSFRDPLRLFPFFILLLSLIWILVGLDRFYNMQGAILCFVIPILFILIAVTFNFYFENKFQRYTSLMDKDWENWREYIKKSLNEKKMLKCSDLEYQAIVRGYGTFGRSIIDYTFWRFAREHQETVRYVFVYDKITNISYDYYTPKNKSPFPVRVLVLLNDFSPDKYVMKT